MATLIPNATRKAQVDAVLHKIDRKEDPDLAAKSAKTVVALLRASDDAQSTLRERLESDDDNDDVVDSNGRRERRTPAAKKQKSFGFEQMLNIPANLSTEQLSMLVNQLLGMKDKPVPYSFAIEITSKGTEEKTVLDLTSSIYEDVLSKGLLSAEDLVHIVYTPQAVFRVRAATRCTSTLEGHDKPILCAQFSPDGASLATGSGDHTVRLWDLQTETPQCTLKGHSNNILCVSFSPNGKYLASGSLDKTVRIWHMQAARTATDDARCLSVLAAHKQWITSLSWEPCHRNPESSHMASSSKDGTVRIWDVVRGHCICTLSGHTAAVNVVCWGGSNLLYSASSDRTIKVWAWNNVEQRAILVKTMSEHAHWVTTLSLSTNLTLQTGPFDHRNRRPASTDEAKVWAQERYEEVLARVGGSDMLVSGSDDFTLMVWDPDHSKKSLARLTGHQKLVNHVTYSSDGRLIASASFDNSVKLWHGKTGKFIASLRGHVASVYRLAFSPDNRLLISASKDTTLKIWDVQPGSKTFGKVRRDLPGHTDEVYCVDWSPKGDKIASGGRDCRVKIWRH